MDNRADLISELRDSLTVNSTDVAIVAAAYEKWGANCLEKLIGDWALSIWNPRDRSVLLAKDPIGTKHLYYSFDDKQLTWSTILDPLVLFAGKTFEICEEYIAGWFAIPVFPAAHLTPYVGIHSVPPSSSVLLRARTKHIVSKYWDFDPGKRIRYRTDAEYEEHFRSVFATAVQRSSAPTAPSSPNSVAAWTPLPSSAWPISSSLAAPPNALASTPSPGSTIMTNRTRL